MLRVAVIAGFCLAAASTLAGAQLAQKQADACRGSSTTTSRALPDRQVVTVHCGDLANAVAVANAAESAASGASAAPAAPADKGASATVTDDKEAQALRVQVLKAAAVFAALLAIGALVCALSACLESQKNGMRFTSYWGGFGGADSGWTLSATAVQLLLAAVLAGASVAIGMVVVGALKPQPASAAAPAAKPPAR